MRDHGCARCSWVPRRMNPDRAAAGRAQQPHLFATRRARRRCRKAVFASVVLHHFFAYVGTKAGAGQGPCNVAGWLGDVLSPRWRSTPTSSAARTARRLFVEKSGKQSRAGARAGPRSSAYADTSTTPPSHRPAAQTSASPPCPPDVDSHARCSRARRTALSTWCSTRTRRRLARPRRLPAKG